jgi:hypothetical protein
VTVAETHSAAQVDIRFSVRTTNAQCECDTCYCHIPDLSDAARIVLFQVRVLKLVPLHDSYSSVLLYNETDSPQSKNCLRFFPHLSPSDTSPQPKHSLKVFIWRNSISRGTLFGHSIISQHCLPSSLCWHASQTTYRLPPNTSKRNSRNVKADES